jgi:hypothetical protein
MLMLLVRRQERQSMEHGYLAARDDDHRAFQELSFEHFLPTSQVSYRILFGSEADDVAGLLMVLSSPLRTL